MSRRGGQRPGGGSDGGGDTHPPRGRARGKGRGQGPGPGPGDEARDAVGSGGAATGRGREEEPTGLRITGGELRGVRLKTPPGKLLRPMRDMVRLALFNILGDVSDVRVLDLFSGSGSLALETLSRGATSAVVVDNEPACLAVLRENVAHARQQDKVEVVSHDLAHGVEGLARHGPFDLVIMHPPFELLRRAPGPGEADPAKLLAGLARNPGLVPPGGTIAFETPRECWREESEITAMGLELELRREYGSTALFITHPKASAT